MDSGGLNFNMAKQRKFMPKESSLDYFDEMRGQMELENKKRRKISKNITPPELQFLHFGTYVNDKFNSQLTGKNSVKRAWKPPVKDLLVLTEPNSAEEYQKTCKMSKSNNENFHPNTKENYMPQSFGSLNTEPIGLKTGQFEEKRNMFPTNNQNSLSNKKFKLCDSILAFHSIPTNIIESVSDAKQNFTDSPKNSEFDARGVLSESRKSENSESDDKTSQDELEMLTQENLKLKDIRALSCERGDTKLEESKCVADNISKINLTVGKTSENSHRIKETYINIDKNTKSIIESILVENTQIIEINNPTNLEESLIQAPCKLNELLNFTAEQFDSQPKESKYRTANLAKIQLTTATKDSEGKFETNASVFEVNNSNKVDNVGVLPENSQTVEIITNQSNEKEKLMEVNEMKDIPSESLSQKKNCDINYYSEHQDIIDSIDIILSEGQDKNTEIQKKPNQTGDFSLVGSIFEDDCPSMTNTGEEIKHLLSNVVENIEKKTVTQIENLNLRSKMYDEVVESNLKEINGYDSDDSQILGSQDNQICSTKEENVIISTKLDIPGNDFSSTVIVEKVKENETSTIQRDDKIDGVFDKALSPLLINSVENMIENNKVDSKKKDTTINITQIENDMNDVSDEDFSPLMISDSQLLEIENKCYNSNLSNINKNEDKMCVVKNSAKTVCTQTENSLLSSPYQQNNLAEARIRNEKARERQTKLRAAIQEVERLNSALLKMRQQLWPK